LFAFAQWAGPQSGPYDLLTIAQANAFMLSWSKLWPLLASASVTLAAIPLMRRLAVRFELFDRPDAGLKPHERPVPYLGGVALYLGWLAAVILCGQLMQTDGDHVWWIVLCGTLLMVVGLVDDVRGLSPALRLLIQVAVGGLLFLVGVGREAVPHLLGSFRETWPQAAEGGGITLVLGLGFSAAVVVGVTNATNLIDGMDGLCAGVVAITSCGLLAVGGLLARESAISADGGALIMMLCVAMLGACLAFLAVNFNPASMFMGDSGALLLGFSVAGAIILFAEHASWRGLPASLACFGFPIFDMTLAVGRRWRNGRPLFVGDRSHFYDQIRDRGLSIRQTVLACYGLCAAFAGLGMVMTQLSGGGTVVLCVAVPVVAALACWWGGMLRVDDAAKRSGQSPG
jgi:UDP-GlcNAc:undecaprenyl-phosphate GlcNAc-1-phosphate transferase